MSEAFSITSIHSTSMSTGGERLPSEDHHGANHDLKANTRMPFSFSKETKKVRFNPRVRARYTLHVKNYTAAELASVWTTSEELASTRNEIRQSLIDIQNGTRNVERGLENRTKSALMRRKAVKNDAKAAVLDEQALQHGEGESDAEYIAYLYAETCRDSRSQAMIRGLTDEQVAQKIDAENCGDSSYTAVAVVEDDHNATTSSEQGQSACSQGTSKLSPLQTPLPSLLPSSVVGKKRRLSAAKKMMMLPAMLQSSSSSASISSAPCTSSTSSVLVTRKCRQQDMQAADDEIHSRSKRNPKWAMGPALRMLIGKAA